MTKPAPLLVVEEAFAVRGGSVQLAPRITLTAVAPRAPFPVLLRLPDGTEKQATAVLDVAHIRGPHGTFALVRLMNMKPADVPVGTEIWRESG